MLKSQFTSAVNQRVKQEEKRGGDERGKTAAPAIINPSIKTIDPNQSLGDSSCTLVNYIQS